MAGGICPGAPASRGCSALRAIFSAVVCTLPDVCVCARCSSSTMATRSTKPAPARADRSPANTRSACARFGMSQLHFIIDRKAYLQCKVDTMFTTCHTLEIAKHQAGR